MMLKRILKGSDLHVFIAYEVLWKKNYLNQITTRKN